MPMAEARVKPTNKNRFIRKPDLHNGFENNLTVGGYGVYTSFELYGLKAR